MDNQKSEQDAKRIKELQGLVKEARAIIRSHPSIRNLYKDWSERATKALK